MANYAYHVDINRTAYLYMVNINTALLANAFVNVGAHWLYCLEPAL